MKMSDLDRMMRTFVMMQEPDELHEFCYEHFCDLVSEARKYHKCKEELEKLRTLKERVSSFVDDIDPRERRLARYAHFVRALEKCNDHRNQFHQVVCADREKADSDGNKE